ncbi:MAG: hypothetical protein AB7T38_16295 [Nitrospirales bacterium]
MKTVTRAKDESINLDKTPRPPDFLTYTLWVMFDLSFPYLPAVLGMGVFAEKVLPVAGGFLSPLEKVPG